MRLLPFLLLVACEPASDDKDTSGTDDTGEADEPSAFTGDWAGTISGYANFAADWETNPYCSGELEVVVLTDGSISGSGECVILWGPYMNSVFTGAISGTVGDDGALSVASTLVDEDDDHTWDDCTITGTADAAGHTGSAACDTLYHPVGLDPIDARLALTLQ